MTVSGENGTEGLPGWPGDAEQQPGRNKTAALSDGRVTIPVCKRDQAMAFLASATIWMKPAGSLKAISDSIFRFSSIPAFFRPWVNRL